MAVLCRLELRSDEYEHRIVLGVFSERDNIFVFDVVAASVNLAEQLHLRAVHPALVREGLAPAPCFRHILFLEALILESVRDSLDVSLIVEPSLPAVESNGGEGCGVGSVHKPRGEGDYGIAFDIEILNIEVKVDIHVISDVGEGPVRRIGHIFLELLSSGSGAQENANR